MNVRPSGPPPPVSQAATTAEARDCPVCGGRPRGLAFPYRTVWNGKPFDYRRCGGCGSTFVDPVPTGDELRAIYAWAGYHEAHYARDDRARFAPSLAFLARHRPGRLSVLDFGCGAGGFLVAARESGHDCRGVEYEATAIEKAGRRAGVPVTSLDEALADGRGFDVVHMTDVLPHLPDPAATLRTLEALVAPGGVFFIEGPLENNPSLVYYAATAAKAVRRRVGLDAPGSTAPTMLVRLDRKAQRDFFGRLGYREVAFEVQESGWPYFVPGRPLRRPGDLLKQAVGALAIALGRLGEGPSRRFGNRFVGIYEPRAGGRP